MAEIHVEVVFATAERQSLLSVSVPGGATIAEVIAVSRVLESFPEQNRENLAVGVWGRLVEDSYVVNDGDRVELYRGLELDPREARRQLALVGKTMSNARAN